jgi:GxxExxY protein
MTTDKDGESKLKHSEITKAILDSFFKVYRTLGYGFLEKVYERAMIIELAKHGISALAQEPVKVYYEGTPVGDFFADLLVESCVAVELKACRTLVEDHVAQLVNYLRGTELEVGLVLNFGPKAGFRRVLFTNDRKQLSVTPTASFRVAPSNPCPPCSAPTDPSSEVSDG